MERETGIEPVTSSLGSWRSTAELLPLNFVRLPSRRIQNNVLWALPNTLPKAAATELLRNSVVPPGLGSSVPLSPPLKRWANIDRPSGSEILKLLSRRLAHKAGFVTAWRPPPCRSIRGAPGRKVCGSNYFLSVVTGAVRVDAPALGGSLVSGTAGTLFPYNGAYSDSGAARAPAGRIPFASTIDQRQSSSGPGVIPIFSRTAVLLRSGERRVGEE